LNKGASRERIEIGKSIDLGPVALRERMTVGAIKELAVRGEGREP